MRLAALADLHLNRMSHASLAPLLSQVTERADVLLMCGDLTHHGLAEEASLLVKELAVARLPIVAVLGNHDYHGGEQETIMQVLRDGGVHVLDGDSVELQGVGFAGVKGFAGGFGRRVLEPWGEDIVKQFVREAVDEALKLESALARLSTPQRIAVTHYAPIAGTVEGEPLEIYPFLGSNRLEEPINRYKVTAAFHGHAHHGKPEAGTSTGIPVYNVSMPLMRLTAPDDPPFRVLEIAVTA
ncbi:MAG TPA: metallophosphoesterase [Candidatus Limnocylindria bacterium]|nr:metallophosphoesterase [Candidatus Limnocylindria bacterium]